jgi:hypothetical protein
MAGRGRSERHRATGHRAGGPNSRARQVGGAGSRAAGVQSRRLRDVGKRRWRDGSMVAERDTERMHSVMRATTVPRNRLQPGVVVLARVPFERCGRDEDRVPAGPQEREPQEKVRPVVVVDVVGGECVCRPCTSSVSRHRRPWAYTEVEDLTGAGLSRPTGVKRRETTVALTDCIEVLGTLTDSDLDRVFAGACVGA